MKVGDKVIHILTGQKMTILKINRSVATLKKDIAEPWIFWGIESPGEIAICKIENLKKI